MGRTVIACARLRATAHGGQTLLSAVTREFVGDRLPDGASVRDLGLHRFKDLGAPERVWQLCHPDLRDDFAPLRSLDALASNLPAQLTSFVGREQDVADLGEVLRVRRLVTLTGAGGCGKTRLAAHGAADVADRYADGVWWVELGSLSDPTLLPFAVARTFGLREEEARPILDTLCDRLAGVDVLLVLDNCEHLVAACADLTGRLLAAAPGMRVLATSREPLAVAGELPWPVPPLGESAAARLFVERAALVRPGFSPDEAELDVIAAICRRLDGIPLAIELAAARARMMSPGRIAAALDDRFRLLTGGGRTALARQQTLEASVAWSYDLLDPAERALLRRLSVFAGRFVVESAEEVCGTGPLDASTVVDVLSRLVDKSLVHVDHDADGRYRLLETIRLYATARLIDAGEADLARERHLDHFLSFAERVEPLIVRADGPAWLTRLEREHDNLRAAMEWAQSSGAAERLLRLTGALTIFWELHGHMTPGAQWLARALASGDAPSAARARALWGAAHLALYSGDATTLATCAPAALALATSPTAHLITITVAADGTAAFAVPRAEVGQGMTTALAMVIADGLDLPLDRVRMSLADARPELMANQFTGASNTMHTLYEPLRTAAALARQRLLAAAADRWNVPVRQLDTRDGAVLGPGGRRADYGSLVVAAASATTFPAAVTPVPWGFPPHPRRARARLVGSPQRRLDAVAAVVGKKQFAMDLAIPGALATMVCRPPTTRGTVRSVANLAAVRAMPGVVGIAPISTGVAVAAPTFGQCIDVIRALRVDWAPGPVDQHSDATVLAALQAAERPLPPPVPAHATTIEEAFTFRFRSGAALEPNCAVADVRRGSAEIWGSFKSPILCQEQAAALLGLAPTAVTVHVVDGGGSFGRHCFSDAALEAVEASRAFGRPVRLMWHRSDDIRHGRVHPMSISRVRATVLDGRVISFEDRHTGVVTDFRHGFGEMFTAAGAGPSTGEGVFPGIYSGRRW